LTFAFRPLKAGGFEFRIEILWLNGAETGIQVFGKVKIKEVKVEC
jgi:hypothetical protein